MRVILIGWWEEGRANLSLSLGRIRQIHIEMWSKTAARFSSFTKHRISLLLLERNLARDKEKESKGAATAMVGGWKRQGNDRSTSTRVKDGRDDDDDAGKEGTTTTTDRDSFSQWDPSCDESLHRMQEWREGLIEVGLFFHFFNREGEGRGNSWIGPFSFGEYFSLLTYIVVCDFTCYCARWTEINGPLWDSYRILADKWCV